MAKILRFSGDTLVDVPPDAVLEAAKGETVKCLVLGWRKGGELWFSGSFSDTPEINYLLDVVKTEVMTWDRE
ncbi:hypothetical protein LCGC14_2780030 [marine sediment metagenome]|uniref:Uncharacterized protein n=1 Tax=marine sediment metagenome TaxID=412755 RepID=A0A0F8YTI4_9ZZZZ